MSRIVGVGVRSVITGGVLVHSSGFPEPRAMRTILVSSIVYSPREILGGLLGMNKRIIQTHTEEEECGN